MLKKLQTKLTLIISLSLSSVLLILLIIINILNIQSNRSESNTNLNNLAKYLIQKNLFDYFDQNNSFIIGTYDYYVIIPSRLGEVSIFKSNPSGHYDDITLVNYTRNIISSGYPTGRINHLIYKIENIGNYQVIIMLDNTPGDNHLRNYIIISILIAMLGIIAIIILAGYLSKWLVKPIASNFQKQRDFISDASHELKTPLTIISANTDLLESEIGSNKWLDYIKTETNKMTKLIQNLLTLSRSENSQTLMEKINLSDLVTSTSMSFESLAYELHITLEYHIQDNIIIQGRYRELQELLTILLDNAIKYITKPYNITVTLQEAKSYIILKVINTGLPLTKEECTKIFDRFYRLDSSHNRNDGHYGLGLSIAKSIVANHHGTITATSQQQYNTFEVKLPRK